MNFTVANPVIGAADVGLAVKALPNPAVLGSNIVYTINVTNFGPATANGIVITNLLPPESVYVSATAPGGTTATTNSAGASTVLVWQIPSLAKDAHTSLTLVSQPTVPGIYTNITAVTASTPDLNPANDVITSTTTVIVPSADLALGLVSQPNTILAGSNVVYSLVVSNLGPGTATRLGVTNVLPFGIEFVSASPAGFVRTGPVGNTVCFTNLGSLGAGGTMTVTVTGRGNLLGTFLDTASCSAAVVDPRKLNNYASVKTVVAQAPTVTFVPSVAGLNFTWTNDAAIYVLEWATSPAGAVWTPVSSTQSSQLGSVKSVTIPVSTSGNKFFRLRATTQ
jgi:uncharacterized repeat protein (TIGR01451 family)